MPGPRPQAGQLDQTVTFRKRDRVPDGGGGFEDTWTDHAVDVPARVRPMRGRERLQAEQLEHRRDYEVTLRYREDITEDMVIVWRGQTLGIRFIEDFGPRALYLRIEAEMGVMTEAAAGS